MTPIKKVIIFGGTHGNEWTGVFAVKKYADNLRQKFPELDLHFVHANPEAFQLNKRFKDEDLNRAFQFLKEDRPESYEHKLAHQYKKIIDEEICFVIDLHTTTSNMGNTVIISHPQPLNFQLASVLAKELRDTRIILSPDPNKKYLASQSEFGMMIEVGPVPNGIIQGEALEGTLKILNVILSSLTKVSGLTNGEIEIFEEIEDVFYPEDELRNISAYIHPDFQNKDFIKVEGRYKAFKTFASEEISLHAKEELYPIFINEAAYYPIKMAFTLCRKRILNY